MGLALVADCVLSVQVLEWGKKPALSVVIFMVRLWFEEP
jgi:hypothetical protein